MRGVITVFFVGLFVTSSCYLGAGSSSSSSGPDAGIPSGPITFYKDVDPILQQNCQRCHTDGGIAPFALLTYDDAKNNADAIVADTQGKIMPPWGAQTTSECTPRFPWKDDMRLSDHDIAIFAAWHTGGDLEGNIADAPPPITTAPVDDLPNSTGLAPATPYSLPSTQTSDYFRCFVLDPQFAATTYMTGTNVKPGNKTIVHHALIFSVPAGSTIPAPTDGVANQYDCFGGPGVDNAQLVAVWVPGQVPFQYPATVAHPIDAGTRFVMQVHYHPHTNAVLTPDTTTFQFATTTTVPAWTVGTALLGNFTKAVSKQGIGLVNPPFLIPPDAPAAQFTMLYTENALLPQVRLLAVAAHMHLAGVDEKITLTRAKSYAGEPDSECLLQVPNWNFNWQRSYEYDTDLTSLPLFSPQDTVTARCTYNNTMTNPALAESLTEQGLKQTQPITIGETTLDEMCLGAYWYIYPTPPP